jgi:hypothetical protein
MWTGDGMQLASFVLMARLGIVGVEAACDTGLECGPFIFVSVICCALM